MLSQSEHENPQTETITTQEWRESILAELEASQQAIAELSDEQLEEIAGGALSDLEVMKKAMALGGVLGGPAAAGTFIGAVVTHPVLVGNNPGAMVGGAGAALAGGIAGGMLIGKGIGRAIISRRNAAPRVNNAPQELLEHHAAHENAV